jgi:hypothetical protein
MSTKDTEKTESISATQENESNDNKKVFGPLGKYAVIGVIMVSIIVTTAIMLNKQLGTVEEQLAAMENEIAEINDTNTSNNVSTEASDTVTESTATIEVAEVETIAVVAETVEMQAIETPVVTEIPVATEETITEVEVAVASEQSTETTEVTPIDVMSASSEKGQPHQSFDMANRDQERQARIEAFKVEQKQRMTEMFARIKTLEAQQLDDYKTSQDKQIERLREQIAKQEKLIEALILRNKEWTEMREARMQRSQSHREKMLERI